MRRYPIFYSFTELVSGEGFFARVKIDGRFLADEEDAQEWWLYGVNPGAIAEGGCSLDDAMNRFRKTFQRYLLDAASMYKSFEAFKAELERFFDESDDRTLAEWAEAVAAIRSGATAPPDSLVRVDADTTRCRIVVEPVIHPTARIATVDEDTALAA